MILFYSCIKVDMVNIQGLNNLGEKEEKRIEPIDIMKEVKIWLVQPEIEND